MAYGNATSLLTYYFRVKADVTCFQLCQAEDPSLRTKFRPASGRTSTESPSGKKESKEKETDENLKHKGRRKHHDSNGKRFLCLFVSMLHFTDVLTFSANESKKSSHKKRNKPPCGQCENCLRCEDCGRCSYCRKAKKARDFTNVEKCLYRQCLNNVGI